MATELGLGGAGDKVRQLMDAMVIMAAETVALQPQPQEDPESEEAKCQYTGTPEQVDAWQKELAKSSLQSPPTLEQQQQQQSGSVKALVEKLEPPKPPMAAESVRAPAVKRAAEGAGTAPLAPIQEEHTDYRFDAEEEAVQELFGSDEEKPVEPQAKTPKTQASSSKSAQDSALELVIELQQQLSSNKPEIVKSDIEPVAASSGSVG